MKVQTSQKIQLNVTNQTKKLKKDDIFFSSKTYDLYLIDEIKISKDKVTIQLGELSTEEKMSLISSVNMSGSVNGLEEGSVFPSENVTIQYN